MSANPNVLESPEVIRTSVPDAAPACVRVLEKRTEERVGWNATEFENAQLLGLARRIFLSDRERPSRHVVFSAVDADTDLTRICVQVAQTLASESAERVGFLEYSPDGELDPARPLAIRPVRNRPTQMANNLWRVSPEEFADFAGKAVARFDWLLSLARLRSEYKYAVIQGPVIASSSQAGFLGKLSDGIVLVLSARSTRRAAARNIKQALQGAQCTILGTVLSQRTFPIPERIYRRL